MNAENYIQTILTPLLRNPNELKIVSTTDQSGKLITVSASKEDMPYIIGRNAKTVDALRVLLHIFGTLKEGQKVSLIINNYEHN